MHSLATEAPAVVTASVSSDVNTLISDYDFIHAIGMTLWIGLWSIVGALLIGTFMAILRLSPVPTLNWVGAIWVTVMRNTPLTLIVIGVNLVLLLQLNIRVGSSLESTFLWLAIFAMAIYHSSFVCEAIRSGVNTIPLGQAEAARSIGLTFSQSLRHIILPQAVRGAITPLGNVLIALIKNTTVVTAIGVFQISAAMSNIIEKRPDLLWLTFGLVAVTFIALTLPLGLLTGYLSNRLAVKR